MRKVLIVSYCFPPIDMIAAKRFGTMCKYFEENGYKPYVLTTKPDGDWGIKAKYGLELPVDGKQIIKIGANSTNGDIKNLLGRSLISILNNCKYHSRTVNAFSLGWYEKVKISVDLAQFKDIDIVVGTFPVIGDLYVACYLARKLKCPYIADVRDLICDYSETPEGYSRAKLLDSIIEKYLLGKAAGIVTVTSGFKKILKKRYPKKNIFVVFNGCDDEKKIICEPKDKKYIYYAGSLYLHRLESAKLLINCVEDINASAKEKIEIVIRSIGPKELDAKIKQFVQQKGMQECVHIFAADDEDIVKEEQENAYINVILSTIHENDIALMTTIPGKIYELLNRQAPILAIVPKNSDIDKVLRYTNKGICSVSENEITDFILRGGKQYTGNANIKYFTRKKQAERFCRFMDKILGK